MKKAVDVLIGGATPIPMEQAEARERLWTPDAQRGQEAAAAGKPAPAGKLWTPGDPR